jgi:DNA-binding transcriptional LysR family regulator
MLDVRRLRVLREVARCGSLAAAASRLSYTASAISQQIAVLEREAGTALLERRARGVVLTEAGRTLVEHAEIILAQLDAAEAALAELADLRRGHLRMASFATAGATVLPWAVDVFRARHPEVELSVAQASPAEGLARVREGKSDLALTADLDPRRTEAQGVEVTHLFDDPIQLALHARHRLAARAEISLADLREETWIDVPRHSSGGAVLARACERVGFVPRVGFESDDYTAIARLVGAGLGLALIPDLAVLPPQASVVLRTLSPDPPWREVQAATRAAGYRSAAASVMLEILLALPSALRHRAAEPVAGGEAGI